jgi:hypothetical protein
MRSGMVVKLTPLSNVQWAALSTDLDSGTEVKAADTALFLDKQEKSGASF